MFSSAGATPRRQWARTSKATAGHGVGYVAVDECWAQVMTTYSEAARCPAISNCTREESSCLRSSGKTRAIFPRLGDTGRMPRRAARTSASAPNPDPSRHPENDGCSTLVSIEGAAESAPLRQGGGRGAKDGSGMSDARSSTAPSSNSSLRASKRDSGFSARSPARTSTRRPRGDALGPRRPRPSPGGVSTRRRNDQISEWGLEEHLELHWGGHDHRSRA